MLYSKFKKNHKEIDLDKLLDSNKIIKFKEGNKILLKDLRTTTVSEVDGREYPKIKPFMEKDMKFYIVCPYCFGIHSHGAIEGHRIQHCSPRSVEKPIEGYIIKK